MILEPGVWGLRQQISAAPRYTLHFTQRWNKPRFSLAVREHWKTRYKRWDDLDHLIVTFNLRNSLWDTDFRPWRFIWNVLQRPFDIHAPICAPIVYNISSWWDVDPKCFLHREHSQVPGQDGPMRKTAGSGTEAFLKPFESIMVTELQWQKP